jgi:hypothetical protein
LVCCRRHRRCRLCHYRYDVTSVVATARHGFAPSLYVDCCLFSDVVCIFRCNCQCQHNIHQRFCHQHSLICQYRLRRCGSPHLQTRKSQQRTGAGDTMVKSCSGERLKKVYFSPTFT